MVLQLWEKVEVQACPMCDSVCEIFSEALRPDGFRVIDIYCEKCGRIYRKKYKTGGLEF